MQESRSEGVAVDARPGWGAVLVQRRAAWLVAAVATCAAGVLDFLFIGRQSFWEDEGASWFFTHDGLGGLAHAIWRNDPNMSLYYLLLHSWLHAGPGDSEAAIRALSAVFAVLTVPLIYLLGSRLFGAWPGAVAAVLFTVNSFTVHYAQEARSYSLVALLVTISSYLFVIELEQPSRRSRVGYVLASALAVYAQFFAAWVLIAQAVTVVAMRERGSIERRWKASFGMILVLCIPAAGQILRFRHGTIDWIPPPTLSRFGGTLDLLAGGSWLLLVLALMATAYAGLHALRAKSNQWQTGFVLIWLGLPIVLVFVFSYVTPLLVARYLIVVVPALSLSTASGICALAGDRRLRVLAVAGMAGLLVLSAVQLHRWYTSPQIEDWRHATQYVLREQRPGDRILFEVGGGKRPFDYYAHRDGQAGPRVLDTTPGGLALAPSSGRVWLIRLHLSPGDPRITAPVRRLEGSGYRLRRSREFPSPRARFSVYLYALHRP